MKVLSAKVVEGRLDIPPGLVREGELVTVLVPESPGDFELSAEQRDQLSAALAEADRGEGVDGWRLLRELGSA